MASLTPYQKSLIGGQVSNIIRTLVSQGRQFKTIVSVVNGPRFRATAGTIQALTNFWRAAKSAGNKLNKIIYTPIVTPPQAPMTQESPTTTVVHFDVKATLRGGKFKTFFNLVIEVPYGTTNEELRQRMEDRGLDIQSGKYEVELVHIIPQMTYHK